MELGQHASLVMTTLDEGINSLDNLDYFFDYLHNAGGLHYKIKGFKKDYFWVSSDRRRLSNRNAIAAPIFQFCLTSSGAQGLPRKAARSGAIPVVQLSSRQGNRIKIGSES